MSKGNMSSSAQLTVAARLSLDSTVRLASGAQMPLLGFGVYQARGDECRQAVKTALEVGYRHSELLLKDPKLTTVDSAQAYHNETSTHKQSPT